MTKLQVAIGDKPDVHLRTLLEKNGYAVVGEADTREELVGLVKRTKPDVVIIDNAVANDGVYTIEELNKECLPIIIMALCSKGNDFLKRCYQPGVVGFLAKPVKECEVVAQLEVANARFSEYQRLRVEVGELKKKMEERKVIEKAKGILIQRCNLSEEGAFRAIQKQSMDENKTMIEIAEAVILAHKMKM